METTRSKHQLPVDLSELVFIFDNRDQGFAHYLDLESGQVVSISEEAQLHLEELFYEYSDDDLGETNLDQILTQMDLYDWQREELLLAKQVESGLEVRFLRIPAADSRHGYRDMVAFIETVPNPRLKTRLEKAIAGRGAFRAFKDLLADYPKERQRWFEFKEARLQERVQRWLADEGINLVDANHPAEGQANH